MLDNIVQIVRAGIDDAVPQLATSELLTSDLFCLAEARRLLEDAAYRCGKFSPGCDNLSFIRDQQRVPAVEYATLANAQQLWRTNATAMFRVLHRNTPKVRAACQEIANRTGLPVNASAYRTPPNSQGFPHHADEDSVIVVQISGKKTWLLFKPQSSESGSRAGWVYEGTDENKAWPRERADHCVTLSSGQVLFIPRLWSHRAFTDTYSSIHVSFGLLHPEMGEEVIERQLPVYPA